jgi:hypothetical protein
MTDEHFLAALADCSLPPAHFNHLGHLRLAWLNLRRLPFEEAVAATCATIRAYATHLGAPGKFHWTITEALLHLLHAAGAASAADWAAFAAAHPALVERARETLALHYSDAVLASEAARSRFVAPDLAPLPR